METIKTTIIKYLEGQGRASKSKIEKEVGELTLSTGDCIARRIRELVAEGVLRKDQKEYQGKKYWEYSVVEPCNHPAGSVIDGKAICDACGYINDNPSPMFHTDFSEQSEKLNL